jgi:predicted phage baseplate assembly protein
MLEQGRGAETLAEALLRAGTERELTERAITLSDAERIARETPGRDIARAVARANTHPGLLGVAAPGVVTLVVVPNRPGPRPFPSPSLIRAVRRRLERTRLLGTAFRVIGPDYRSVGCRALLRARREAGPAQVRGRAVAALDIHLDPLRGGADGTGWPLGRDVYRSEIMALLEAIEGVDHVLSLELLTEQGEAACGDLCLGPLTLVAPAPHEIEVLR